MFWVDIRAVNDAKISLIRKNDRKGEIRQRFKAGKLAQLPSQDTLGHGLLQPFRILIPINRFSDTPRKVHLRIVIEC